MLKSSKRGTQHFSPVTVYIFYGFIFCCKSFFAWCITICFMCVLDLLYFFSCTTRNHLELFPNLSCIILPYICFDRGKICKVHKNTHFSFLSHLQQTLGKKFASFSILLTFHLESVTTWDFCHNSRSKSWKLCSLILIFWKIL